jgi:hypothetical protein
MSELPMRGLVVNRMCHVKIIEALLLSRTLDIFGSEPKMRYMYSPNILVLFNFCNVKHFTS